MIPEVAHQLPSQQDTAHTTTAQVSRPPPPPLPTPHSLEIPGTAVIKYIDVKPPHYAPASTPTVALIHGSPGSYKDFRYLVPLLQPHARVVALNLPGFDDSVVTDEANRFEHVTARGVAQIAYDALAQICRDAQHVFLVGHSFGGHTTTNMAALDLEQKQLHVKGIGFLASAGHRPHRTLWPKTVSVMAALIRARLPIVSPATESLSHSIYTRFVGFPDNGLTHHYVSSVIRADSTDYDLVNRQRKETAHIPAFVAWAKDDVHIEEELSLMLSDVCHPGPRFAFDKGGHNIQKTQAQVLALELTNWIKGLIGNLD